MNNTAEKSFVKIHQQKVALTSFIIIVIALVLVVTFSKWSEKVHNKRYSRQTIREVKSLVRESNFIYISSQQDSDPIIKLNHLVQSISLLSTARRIINPADLMKITKVDVDVMLQELEKQKEMVMNSIRTYNGMKNVMPDDASKYLPESLREAPRTIHHKQANETRRIMSPMVPNSIPTSQSYIDNNINSYDDEHRLLFE